MVTSGSFLVDAETRLNPAAGSIYFGGSGLKTTGGSVTTVRPTTPDKVDAKLQAALKKLLPVDRALAEWQEFCPVLENSRLGSMGVPVKLIVNGQPVFVCCPACESQALADPDATLKKIAAAKGKKPVPSHSLPTPPAGSNPEAETKIRAALADPDAADRQRAEQQRFCVILTNSRLGSMGILLILSHVRSIFVICITLPLAVLFSFLLMWILRTLGIIDIQVNIMSLAGITISIGILVDQAIVMTENATRAERTFRGATRHRGHAQTGDSRLPHRGPADLLLRVDHAALVRHCVHAQRPGRQAVSSPGGHPKFCAHRRGDHFDYGRAGVDPHVHPRTFAPRGGQSDRPQLHPHLQTAADMGTAATKPRDVDVCGVTDPRRGHVSLAGDHRTGSVRSGLENDVSAGVLRCGESHGRLDKWAARLLVRLAPRRLRDVGHHRMA